jgi:murein DD-endopeptidase MepM/ murein hydrolase activator NlpD
MGHRPRRGPAFRPLLFGLLLAITAVLAAGGSPLPLARASDPLTDALAQQRALQAKIAAERAAIHKFQVTEAQLNAQIAATQVALDKVNADLVTVKTNIGKASASLKAVRARYTQLVAQVQDLDWQLQALQSDLQDSQQALADARATLSSHLAEAYRAQQTSLLEQLLTADSLATVLADVGYYLHIGDQDAQLAAQISGDEANVRALQRGTEATRIATQQTRVQVYHEKETVTAQRDALVRAQKQLAQLEAQTQAIQRNQLAAYNKVRRSHATAAADLSREQAALDDLKTQIDSLLSQTALPSEYNGTLIWPMTGIVSQEFGCTGFVYEPPQGSCSHFHTGIDIVNDRYTPIHAAGDGVVIFAGPNPFDPPWARAWIVIIAHSSRLLSWYAHIDDATHPPIVQKGQTVHQGDVIAYEGNTGNSTGPHLHWAVELDHTFVNPRLFL